MRANFVPIIIGFIATFPTSPAVGKTIELLPPLGELSLREPDEPPPAGGPFTYSDSGASPTWFVSQWSIAGPKLSPFADRPDDAGNASVSTAPAAKVEVKRSNGKRTISLSQTGEAIPCKTPLGKPKEADLFISAKLRTPSRQIAGLKDLPTLEELSQLRQVVDVSVTISPSQNPKGCEVSKGGVALSLILSNNASRPKQTLFYQMFLQESCFVTALNSKCNIPADDLRFFWSKNPFGVNDRLKLITDERFTSSRIDVDLRPRLVRALNNGPKTLDKNLSNWKVTAAYAGHIMWGDVDLQSQWREYRLVAHLR